MGAVRTRARFCFEMNGHNARYNKLIFWLRDMETNDEGRHVVEWRWDRFNVRNPTSTEWAGRSCTGQDSNNTAKAKQDMQLQVIRDQKQVDLLITAEIHELVRAAALITGLTYKCKFTQHQIGCISIKDIQLSWVQDGGPDNMKRLAWMLYYFGSVMYMRGMAMTHGNWVEQKVMSTFNIKYVHLKELNMNQRTCMQQLYSKKMNNLRSNILRRTKTVIHTSQIQKEQPKVAGAFNKNFKRDKATFFATLDITNKTQWSKVSIRSEMRSKTQRELNSRYKCIFD